MEILTAKDILQLVHSSIQTISRILAGTEMLSAKSQKEATELLKGSVPSIWESSWEGPENPIEWISGVNKKARALIEWMKRVQQRQLLERAVNLSDLFHPDTFLNALRQRSARQLKIAIDELKLVSSFEQNKISGGTAIALEGLWLQGCEFDGRSLTDIQDSSANARELIPLPPCFVGWIGKTSPDPYTDGVNTPIYHSLDREKLLCTLDIPNQGTSNTRIISGVALFLSGSAA